MKRNQIAIIEIVLLCFFAKYGQSQHVGEYEQLIHKDTSLHSFVDFFQKGHLHGHVRNYFMATVNKAGLQDYWTNATGGAIKFETAEWYGFQIGVKGIFSYQTLSSDLNSLDTLAGKAAKWERELYDTNRPNEYTDLDRLEELYLKFSLGKSFIEFGKIDINEGPLFLRRDGRMKPFVYRGMWSEIEELTDQKFSLGVINGVSPRGMTEWFSLNEAIGILNNGQQPDGSRAHYHEQLKANFILVGGYEYEKHESLKLQFWNYFFDKMSNIMWFQADAQFDQLIAGVQFVNQLALSDQKLLSYSERYIQPHERSNVFNVLVGYQNNPQTFSISTNYFHSFKGGRFLFPKELGRENFYISDARSWMEGLGGVNAYMVNVKYKPAIHQNKIAVFQLRLSKVDTQTEDVLNKYNTPSYKQLSFDTRLELPKKLKGLSFRLLYITRKFDKHYEYSLAEKFYRSNYHHFNLITNIEF